MAKRGHIKCIVCGTAINLYKRDKCPKCGKSYPYWGHLDRNGKKK